MNNIYIKIIVLLGVFLFIISCEKDDPSNGSNVAIIQTNQPYNLEYSYLPPPNLPEDNPLTVDGVKLGKMLFFEKRLSEDNSLACAGCHLQEDAFSDNRQFSIGTQGLEGARQAMAVVNLAWNDNGFFWDGRSPLLRDQSLKPIEDPLEMNETLENAVYKLSLIQSYKNQFIRAFGSDEITAEKMSLAMEQFMFTLVSTDSKFDRFVLGQDEFTESELRGKELFETEYNPGSEVVGGDCVHCHSGFNFQNNLYMNNGLDSDENFEDVGRFDVTANIEDMAKFKVPTLRNVGLTAPYMHDGRFETLEEVLNHYNAGIINSTTIDPALQNTIDTGLGLTDQDIQDIIAFLHTLTDYTFISNPEFADPF